MSKFYKVFAALAVMSTCLFQGSACALEDADKIAIQTVIKDYADAWNLTAGQGFADNFTTDADFVNIFGHLISGQANIEARHVHILGSFLKNTQLTIEDIQLREVQSGLVIAHVKWHVDGFQCKWTKKHAADNAEKSCKGIFTQVFVNADGGWQITASQNTLIKARHCKPSK